MSNAIHFDYKPGDDIHVVPLNVPGVVTAVWADLAEKHYSVRYWWNGEVKTVYMLPEEIRPKEASDA